MSGVTCGKMVTSKNERKYVQDSGETSNVDWVNVKGEKTGGRTRGRRTQDVEVFFGSDEER